MTRAKTETVFWEEASLVAAGQKFNPFATPSVYEYLRERDMGMFEIMSEDDKKNKYPEVYRQYEFDPFYWRPPNGESIAQLCLRIDRVLHTLHRECSNKRVLIVGHGLVMWAFMVRIERLTPTQFLQRSQ